MRDLNDDEIKKELVKMLEKLDEFLVSKNIAYSVTGGTLIGTIRHRGFIPWDDDIDLMVTRNDYEKIRKFKNEILNLGNYDIYCVEDGTSEFPFIKFVNKDIMVEQINISSMAGDFLWIDIFPVDVVPTNEKKAKKIYRKMHLRRLLLESAMMKQKGNFQRNKSTKIKKMFSFFTRLIGAKKIGKSISNESQKYCKSNSNYLGGIVWGYGTRETFDKEIMQNITRKVFENIYVNCITEFDGYLKNIYGNYMELPPENQRNSHQIKAWMKMKGE